MSHVWSAVSGILAHRGGMLRRVGVVLVALALAAGSLTGLSACDSADPEVDAATEQAGWELDRLVATKAGTLSNGVYGALGSFPTGSDFAKAYMGKVTYELGDVTVSGKTATTEVTLTCPDYGWLANRALSLLHTDYTTLPTMGEPSLNNEVEAAMTAALGEDDLPLVEHTAKLTLGKVGGKWVADDAGIQAVAAALWDGSIVCNDGAWSYTDNGKMQLATMWVALFTELADDPAFFANTLGLNEDFAAELEACGWSVQDYYAAILAQTKAEAGKTAVSGNVVSTVLHVTAVDGTQAMTDANEAAVTYSQTDEAQSIYFNQGEQAVQHEVYGVLFDALSKDTDAVYTKDITLSFGFSGTSVQLDTTSASQYAMALAGQGTADE